MNCIVYKENDKVSYKTFDEVKSYLKREHKNWLDLIKDFIGKILGFEKKVYLSVNIRNNNILYSFKNIMDLEELLCVYFNKKIISYIIENNKFIIKYEYDGEIILFMVEDKYNFDREEHKVR